MDAGSKRRDGTPRLHRGQSFRSPKMRSKTFEGIAEAMAQQWSAVLTESKTNK